MKQEKTCEWLSDNPLMIKYHDTEWGVPLHDDRKLFEYIVLDGFQAGLSWSTIINKRENFRKSFDNFDAEKISKYKDNKIQKLLNDKGIIRNKLKIYATIENAKLFLKIKEEYGSFDRYIWQFTGGKTIINKWKSQKDVPSRSEESDLMSKDMKKRGFRFCGSTICYAFMQAAGMVNDHLVTCFRYKEINHFIRKNQTR